MVKYLLSTGDTTTKIEEYVLDLFKMNLVVRPDDIPHYSTVGFDFSNSLKNATNMLIINIIRTAQ